MRGITDRSREGSRQANLIAVVGWLGVLLLLAGPAAAQQDSASELVDPDGPGEGAQPEGGASKHQIVVSLRDRKLALIEDGRVVKVYAIAVGKRATPSPTGEFKILNRIPSPTYYHSGQAVPPGKANPLGTRWMGLSKKGYGIHGTNAPNSIGQAASHGCIRMRKGDVEELFQLVRVGDTVEIMADSEVSEWARASAASRALTAKSTEPAAGDLTPAALRPSALVMTAMASE